MLKSLALAHPSKLLGRHCENESPHWDIVMLLRDTADLAAIRDSAPRAFEAGMPFDAGENRLLPVSILWIRDDLFAQLNCEQVCRGCASLSDEANAAPQFGLYFYDAGDQYQSGPYERGPVPAQPVQLAALPTFVRETLAAVAFPAVRFHDAAAIQPLEHLPCTTWGADQYLASDLKTLRPIPPKAGGR